jgi:5-methylcytosine-specific restriction protein B
MKNGVYRDGGLERTWRTKILPLLAEHHYGDDVDVDQRYGLTGLRAAVASMASPESESTDST